MALHIYKAVICIVVASTLGRGLAATYDDYHDANNFGSIETLGSLPDVSNSSFGLLNQTNLTYVTNSTIGLTPLPDNQTDYWNAPVSEGNYTSGFNYTLANNGTNNSTGNWTAPSPDYAPVIEDLIADRPIEGGPGNDPCTGVAYDGYLTNCAIYLDSNGNSKKDESESSVLSSNGLFTLPAPSINLQGYIIRMEPAETEALSDEFVAPGSDICHDIATLLPERLPLAARPPNTCQNDSIIALSPISTLMTLPGVSAERVEAAFSIPRNANIGSTDILRGALDGNLASLNIMKKEILVKNIVSQTSQAIARKNSVYRKVASACFQAVGRAIASPAAAQSTHLTSNRRLLYASEARLFATQDILLAIFNDILEALATDSEISITDVAYLELSAKNSIVSSITNFNYLLNNHTSTTNDIFKLAILIQKDIMPKIQQFVNGNITAEDFANSTDVENLVRSFDQVSLPDGSIADPTTPTPAPSPMPAPEEADQASPALALGLGLGLGIPAFLSVAYVVINKASKRKVKKTSIKKDMSETESHAMVASSSI